MNLFSKLLLSFGLMFGAFAHADTVAVQDSNFSQSISNGVVIVDVYADWCGPCKRFGPTFEKLSNEMTDVVFAKLNADYGYKVLEAYKVKALPTIILFVNGVEVARQEGEMSLKDLRNFIQRNI